MDCANARSFGKCGFLQKRKLFVSYIHIIFRRLSDGLSEQSSHFKNSQFVGTFFRAAIVVCRQAIVCGVKVMALRLTFLSPSSVWQSANKQTAVGIVMQDIRATGV